MSYRAMGILSIVTLLALLPFGLIARSRAQRSGTPAPHLFLDMDQQAKYLPQSGNRMFDDGRAMRPVLPGVVAREDLMVAREPIIDGEAIRMVDGKPEALVLKDRAAWDRVMLGQQKGANGQAEFVATIPAEIPVTLDLMRRGQDRYAIYCTPCHGYSGYGDGMVHKRAAALQEAGGDASNWVQPTSFHSDDGRKWTPGHLYSVVTNGIRSMPRYDKQTSVTDRWAIVAYVKALQRARHSTDLNDLPEVERGTFER